MNLLWGKIAPLAKSAARREQKNLFAANAARRAAVTQNPRLHSATSRRTVQEIQLGLTDKQVHSCSLKPQCQLSASFHFSSSKCVELLATIRNVHVDVSTHVYHHNQEYLNVTPDQGPTGRGFWLRDRTGRVLAKKFGYRDGSGRVVRKFERQKAIIQAPSFS